MSIEMIADYSNRDYTYVLERVRKEVLADKEHKDLTIEELSKLSELNQHLTQLEQEIEKEVSLALSFALQRKNDPESLISDVGSDIFVEFYLSEDDPAYDEECLYDNILMILSASRVDPEKADWGLDDGNNHNEFEHWTHHPMFGDTHCWTFHGLYDHTDLTFWEILRIGRVSFSIDLQMA